MKAHIFYNGDDISLPDETKQSNWGGYVNPDSAKMFAVCADSWRANGWEVERLVCHLKPWKGRLAYSSYPYNGLIPAIVNSGMHEGGMFIVTTDVINVQFRLNVKDGEYAYIPFSHFTMAAGWFSEKWFEDALMLLTSYDEDLLKDVPEHTDEGVLRASMDMQKYCKPSHWLKHYSRSMLSRELNKYITNTV